MSTLVAERPVQPATLVDVLERHARSKPDQMAMTFLERGERPVDSATFAELAGAARRVAGHLVARGLAGKPVLLAFEPGLDFIRCFLGCLYAGAIAVPLPGVGQRRARARTAAIVADVGHAALLTDGEGAAQDAAMDAGGPGPAWIAAADALAAPALAAITAAGRDDPAFIQYTSGSTSRPRGIVVTHGNIMANLAMIAAAFAEDGRTIGVGWLPHSHDMGLIGCILHPLHVGASCYLMSPLAFLQKPVRWLRAIDRYRGTVSGGPNFGYELCARHIRPHDLEGLDLSCWRLAGCGAEPVRLATMERFAALLAPHGFSDAALYPCYGLAEATLFATGGTAGTGVRTRILARPGGTRQPVVSCGRPWLGARCIVRDPETAGPPPADGIGEICVAGPHVSPGIWSAAASAIAPDTAQQVQVDGETFVRTGDLGTVVAGETFIVGRLKDMIISRGVNICAEDVEDTIAALAEDGPTVSAALALADREAMALVCEMRRDDPRLADPLPLLTRMREAVAEAHGILLTDIAVVAPGVIARTTSGKIQRRAMAERFERAALPTLASLSAITRAARP